MDKAIVFGRRGLMCCADSHLSSVSEDMVIGESLVDWASPISQ